MPVDQSDEFLVELAQRHLDDVERRGVDHAMAAVLAALESDLPHQVVDAPAAAVDDDRIHADEPQQRDVAREAVLQHGIGHRRAAEADDQRLAVITQQERQRLGQHAGLLHRGNGSVRGGGLRVGGGHGRAAR